MIWKLFKKAVRQSLRYAQFCGTRYYCALCGRHARVFIPVTTYPGQKVVDTYHIMAMGNNPHYRCPWCNSSDKERLVWRYLTKKSGLLTTKKSLSILHIAPEKNTQKQLRARPNITYIAGDKFSGASKYTPEHYGGAIYLDVTDVSQFQDGTFDMIICNHVLEHVPDDVKGMQELYRVLKSGGFAILQVPVSRDIENSIEDANAVTDEERIERFGQSDHVRIYAEKDYLARLASADFSVENIPCASLFSAKEEAELWGVNQKESVYVARKRSGILTL